MQLSTIYGNFKNINCHPSLQYTSMEQYIALIRILCFIDVHILFKVGWASLISTSWRGSTSHVPILSQLDRQDGPVDTPITLIYISRFRSIYTQTQQSKSAIVRQKQQSKPRNVTLPFFRVILVKQLIAKLPVILHT